MKNINTLMAILFIDIFLALCVTGAIIMRDKCIYNKLEQKLEERMDSITYALRKELVSNTIFFDNETDMVYKIKPIAKMDLTLTTNG